MMDNRNNNSSSGASIAKSIPKRVHEVHGAAEGGVTAFSDNEPFKNC